MTRGDVIPTYWQILIVAEVHGTNEPICAIVTMAPTARIYVDLPPTVPFWGVTRETNTKKVVYVSGHVPNNDNIQNTNTRLNIFPSNHLK